jgi:hypothetical protein
VNITVLEMMWRMLFLLDDGIHALTEFGREFDVGSGKSGLGEGF